MTNELELELELSILWSVENNKKDELILLIIIAWFVLKFI